MTDHEKPAERALDGLSGVVQLAAEHSEDSPKPGHGQRLTGYPFQPAARFGATGGTSEAARDRVRAGAPKMLDRIVDLLAEGNASPEQLHAKLKGRGVPSLLTSVRARVCQLNKQGRVCDSGTRGIGESGSCKVIVWRLSTPDELALFLARSAAEAEHGQCPHD
jgi:hypothetical protein